MTLHLRIGSLLLEGISPGERDRVVADFERELGRLLASRAAEGLDRSVARRVVHAAPIVSRRDDPHPLGAQIARAVFDALGSTDSARRTPSRGSVSPVAPAVGERTP